MKERVFAICSGNGGVGRSTLAAALAFEAASEGQNTILLDACGPSRACDLLLGLESTVAFDLCDVLSGEAPLEYALCRAPQRENLRYCCASLDGVPFREVAGAALALRSLCDVLVVDLPAGELALETGLLAEDDVRVLIARPDDVSLRATENLLMRLAGEKGKAEAFLNRMRRESVKKGIQYDEDTASQILDRRFLGCLYEDDAMAARVGKGRSRFPLAAIGDGQLVRAVRAVLKA